MKQTLLPLLCLSAVATGDPGDLPSPHLFPTTKAIHALIVDAAGPADEAAMEAYKVEPERAPGASLDMLPIPGGTFTLGSPESEQGRGDDEGPQRKVIIEPFWMGKIEVTWAMFYPFMEGRVARNKDGTLDRDSNQTTSEPPEIRGNETLVDTVTQPTPAVYVPLHLGLSINGYDPEYPAINLSQHAANKFCEWLSAQTGHFYRLPTEAEWEYACRAGTTTAWHFGDDPAMLDDYAWHAGNSEFKYQRTGAKKPNPWGLHDMHGNVAEHVLDPYLPDAYAKIADGVINPFSLPASRYPTVVRGGHWNGDPEQSRSAARLGSSPEWKTRDPQLPRSIWYFTDASEVGFRIVRPLKTPSLEEMHRYWNIGPGDWDYFNPDPNQ